jgi:hypothetical protein
VLQRQRQSLGPSCVTEVEVVVRALVCYRGRGSREGPRVIKMSTIRSLYVKRNVRAHSCNDCSSGKAILFWVCVRSLRYTA